ncbi:hypothetical protein [Microbacterium sp. Leaf179]|uniref:hypothetical protein n=1 Tax=Microbacterium sp. Leaf179 TaxID=1736288 RepID=UPI0006F3FEE8|nr:hypothetical protein [Microbacterium sp. Leaf179]KQR86337.1 hypothetical protein ASF96_08070 [Microbacterium sp. Leaf179]
MVKKKDDVVEEVRYAMSQPNREDLIDGVKKAVTREVRRLDPGIKVERTNYFNHTYNPDLVATWSDQGVRKARPIFIRGSLASVLDSADVVSLSDQDPVLIGLREETETVLSNLRERLPKSNGSLATQVASVARITDEADFADSDSQLSGLVRTNLIRGARGVLTAEDADTITAVEGDDAAASLQAFQSTVARLFIGATADRLNRTVNMLTTFFEDNPSQDELDRVQHDPLSDGELAVVLPFVLERAESVSSPAVWDALASMLTLQRLESIAKSLDGLDLTPVIAPIVHSLIGAKSTIAFPAGDFSVEELAARPAAWRVRSTMLSADVGRWNFFVGSSSRKIRGRDEGSDARWDELSGLLREFDLRAVSLRGLSRHLEVTGEDPREVRQDVESIRQNIQDDFHVPAVTVEAAGEEEATGVMIDFGAMTVAGAAPVSFHLKAASLLTPKAPFDQGLTMSLLSEGSATE